MRPTLPQVTTMPIKDIEVRDRSRVVLTNIDSLAESIRTKGLLHPPVIRKDGKVWVLVAGQRRLEAVRLLGEEYVTVTVAQTVTDEILALQAEGEENTEREPFTPEEAVRHRKRLEAAVAAQAKKRMVDAGRKSAPGRPAETSSNLEEVSPPEHQRTTRAITAKGTGYSASTLDKAEKVVEAVAEKPELKPVLDEMNRTGKVDPAFKQVQAARAAAAEAAMERIVRGDPAVAADLDRLALKAKYSKAVVGVSTLLTLDAAALSDVLDDMDKRLIVGLARDLNVWAGRAAGGLRIVKEAQ